MKVQTASCYGRVVSKDRRSPIGHHVEGNHAPDIQATANIGTVVLDKEAGQKNVSDAVCDEHCTSTAHGHIVTKDHSGEVDIA